MDWGAEGSTHHPSVLVMGWIMAHLLLALEEGEMHINVMRMQARGARVLWLSDGHPLLVRVLTPVTMYVKPGMYVPVQLVHSVLQIITQQQGQLPAVPV